MRTPARAPVQPDEPHNGTPTPPAQVLLSSIVKSRTAFDRELERLQDKVLVLGSMVEQATLKAIDALRARDMPAARAIEAEDTLLIASDSRSRKLPACS